MPPLAQFETYVPLARRAGAPLALKLTRNHRDDAEDLLQEALLKAYRNFATFNPPRMNETVFRVWFRKVVLTTFLDRRSKTPRLLSLDADDPYHEGGMRKEPRDTDPACDPQRALFAKCAYEHLAYLWRRLPKAERQALYLETFEEDEHAVQARRLGKARATFSNRVSLARQLLRQMIEAEQETGLLSLPAGGTRHLAAPDKEGARAA